LDNVNAFTQEMQERLIQLQITGASISTITTLINSEFEKTFIGGPSIINYRN